MPLILGTNSIKDTGYEVANSLRLESGSSDNLTRSQTSGNRNKATFSAWVKRSKLGANQGIFGIHGASSDAGQIEIRFQSSGEGFHISGQATNWRRTNRHFRDVSAWHHLVVAFDTTLSTASDRVKVYVNGVQETSFSTSNNPSQDANTPFNEDGKTHYIGTEGDGSSAALDGYLAEFHYIDGTKKAYTDFGEFDDNGVWVPIEYTGSHGTNGFYLEFKQTGTSANSSGIGADTSGNDNHMSVTNLAATDVTTDTPTNNFATINPLASIATLSEGNCKVVTTNGERMAGASTIGFENGKWYMEYKVTDINSINMTIGIDNENGLSFSDFRDNDDFWNASNTYAYENNGNKRSTGVNSSYGNSYTTGDIIGVAVDMDNRKIYFSKNGTFQNSGDPTTGSTGTGSAFDLTDGLTYFFQAADNDSSSGVTLEANFGNPSFSISSGNSDANGYGNFEYAPPSGYYSLCTKNLAEYG